MTFQAPPPICFIDVGHSIQLLPFILQACVTLSLSIPPDPPNTEPNSLAKVLL